jgi:hypothetical protein
MKRLGITAALLMLVLALAPAVDATTTWTARPSGHGTASVRVGSPSRLVLGLTGFRPGSIWTVSLRRGSCATLGALVTSLRVTASSTGRLARTVTLTSAQTRVVRLPLTLRYGKYCAPFNAPDVVVPAPTPPPAPSPTPVPTPTAGATRANPIPLGQSARAGDWTLTVTGISADAWPAIQAANMYNDPPAAGQQFFMIAVAATYMGTGSGHLNSGMVMRAVGGLNVGYTTFNNHCGVLPEPNLYWNDPEVFTGGSVSGNAACWAISTPDASSLVMYFEPFLSGDTVWFALR